MSWLLDWALSLVPWWVWVGAFAGIALIIWGFAERFVLMAWAVAGWKGLVGGLIIVLTAVAFVLSILRPGKRVTTEEQYPHPEQREPRRRTTILRDTGEPVPDWWERVTGRKRR